ncbi:hypothetical protein [Amycolatopsis magusensis]|uniref:hypothetical protein n=1 Tax=Amycolatopsis magusensis TaxID=882444 RepID=UPI003C2B2656
MYLAERELVEPLDQWLGAALAPHRLSEAINEMCEAQSDLDIDPGADPQLVAGWMAEVQARRAEAMARSRTAGGRRRMPIEEIQGLVEALGSIRQVLAEADPTDKAAVYRQLGLRLTYQPGKRTVRAEAKLDSRSWGYRTCPRPELHTNHTAAVA